MSRGGRSPFVDVTPPGRRAPSWIAKHRAPSVDVRSLRPAPIPKEFVDAIQHEMALNTARLDESVALHRATRPPSEVPPSRSELGRPRRTTRAPSSTPTATRPPTQEPSSPFASEPFESELSLPPSVAANVGVQSSLPSAPGPASIQGAEALRQALENLMHARSVVFDTAAGQLAELAATIARRVISHELSVTPHIVKRLVDEGLHALEKEDHVMVRIGAGFAAEQAWLVEQYRNENSPIEVVVDPTLSNFGCVVETDHGWVDESIESRLAALLQELQDDAEPS